MSAAAPPVKAKKAVAKKARVVFESPFTQRLASTMNAAVEAKLRQQVLAAFAPFERRRGAKSLAKQAASLDKNATSPSNWSDLTRSVALGVNAVARALEQRQAVGVVVCGCETIGGRPEMLVAHLFAAAAARDVPLVDLKSLDGFELAQSVRMRTLGAFAVLRDAPVAAFVALGDAVRLYAPRATALPWVAVYLTDVERADAKSSPTASAEPRKRLLAPAQTRRVRIRRGGAPVDDAAGAAPPPASSSSAATAQ